MKFYKEIIREIDNTLFKLGDKVNGVGAGEYYIGCICTNERYNDGIEISGYKKLEDVYKNEDYPENTRCGFNGLTGIEHV